MTTPNNRRFNRSLTTLFALALSLVFAGAAFAGQSKARSPEARDNQSDLRDDVGDLQRLSNLIDDWHDAYRRSDTRSMATADAQISAWLRREVGESRTDVAEARREATGSKRAVQAEARDAAAAFASGHYRAAAREVAQVAADSAEYRDDRSDLRTARLDLNRTRSIAGQLATLEARFDRGTATKADFDRKSALLKELQAMARAELGADRAEIREDRR